MPSDERQFQIVYQGNLSNWYLFWIPFMLFHSTFSMIMIIIWPLCCRVWCLNYQRVVMLSTGHMLLTGHEIFVSFFIYIQMDNFPPQIECCTSCNEVGFFPDFRQNGGFFNLTKYKLQWWRLSSWTVCDEIENVSEIFCYRNWKSESDHWSLLLWSGNAGCMM